MASGGAEGALSAEWASLSPLVSKCGEAKGVDLVRRLGGWRTGGRGLEVGGSEEAIGT